MSEPTLEAKRRLVRRLESLHQKYSRYVNSEFSDAHRQYQLACNVHSESRQELSALFTAIQDIKQTIRAEESR